MSEHVALLFLDEGRREPVDLLVTPKLASALVRAAESRIDKEKDLSFTSLFVGLWATQGHPVTQWMVETLSGKPFQNLLSKAGLTERDFERLRQLPDDALGRFRTGSFTRTVSARSALDEAARLARDLDDVPDLHHVVAAFLSLPHYHDADFRNFHVDRPALAANFGSRMAHAYRDQATFWDGFAARVFPQTRSTPSASDSSSTGEESRSSDPPRALDLGAGRAEPAVITALNLAAALAAKEPVGPRSALLAALALADRGQSVAFRRLARIVPITPDDEAKRHARTVSSNPAHEPPQLTQELFTLLAGAQQAQRGSGTERGLWGRDLVTALLLADDPALRALLEQNRCALDDVRDQWFSFVATDETGKIPRSYWEDFWGRAGVPLPAPYRSGYATETDQGEDKLGIEGEARAFARLILDRKVTPPLSIGLLGDWGSGKSFFIEQIKKEIATLRQDSHAELYSNVIEIEFNAWHVSDSNLWASLVTHIFDQIWDKVSAPDASEKTN